MLSRVFSNRLLFVGVDGTMHDDSNFERSNHREFENCRSAVVSKKKSHVESEWINIAKDSELDLLFGI